MNSNMVKPEKFDHLHLVYHFTVPLSLFYRYYLGCSSELAQLVPLSYSRERSIVQYSDRLQDLSAGFETPHKSTSLTCAKTIPREFFQICVKVL